MGCKVGGTVADALGARAGNAGKETATRLQHPLSVPGQASPNCWSPPPHPLLLACLQLHGQPLVLLGGGPQRGQLALQGEVGEVGY